MKTQKKSLSVTKKFSQKPTNESFRAERVTRETSTGRFKDMSENIEKFDPIVIPGYKVRG